jgi:lysine 2,3-aminomutase
MVRVNTFRGAQGFEDFCDLVGIDGEERTLRREALATSHMPFKVTESYAELIAGQDEPYKTQMTNIVVPPVGVQRFSGRFDPYGNKRVRQEDRAFLQHKYEPTLLVHIDDFCISNCQFCYLSRYS